MRELHIVYQNAFRAQNDYYTAMLLCVVDVMYASAICWGISIACRLLLDCGQ